MKLFMRMVLVAAVAVVLMNMESNEACRVLNTDVLQKGTVNPPQLPTFIKQVVQRGLDNEGMTATISSTTNQGLDDNLAKRGFYIPLVIRQRLQKGNVPSGGNPGTNLP